MSRYYDVMVSGAGPAGLAAAIHAARAGLDVVVFDPHGPGVIDKACGEGIMPGGVDALHSMGVSPAGRPFMGIRYVLADDPTCDAFGNFPFGGGLGVRRTVLSEALHARAQRVGVRFREEPITTFTQTASEVTLADGTAARWLIAADGLRSPIRRALDLELPPTHPLRFGLRRHYALSPWSMHVEVHFANDAEAYVTPVANDLVGVAILFEDAALSASDAPSSGGAAARFDALLSRFPHLSERLMASEAVTPVRGAGPFEHRVKQRVVQNVLLIGDAAGYLDPLTGEGIALGAATAHAAIEALRAEDPLSYERRYHQITRRYFSLTSALLSVVRHPRLHRPLIRVAHAVPGLFDSALGALSHLDPHENRPHGPLLPEAPVV
jgi:flavin-dependent dehydrogenase